MASPQPLPGATPLVAPHTPAAPEVDPRLVWAAERTLLAWVRTGLALLAFGFLLARASAAGALLGTATAPTPPELRLLGLGVMVTGAGLMVDAAWRHLATARALLSGRSLDHSPRRLALVAFAVAGAGLLVVAWLASGSLR